MSISVIWKLLDNENKNLMTLQCLKEQIIGNDFEVQVLIYQNDNSKYNAYVSVLEQLNAQVEVHEGVFEIAVYMDAQKYVNGDIVTFINSGDLWSADTLKQMQKVVNKYPKYHIYMLHKIMADGTVGAFSRGDSGEKISIKDFENEYNCYPF